MSSARAHPRLVLLRRVATTKSALRRFDMEHHPDTVGVLALLSTVSNGQIVRHTNPWTGVRRRRRPSRGDDALPSWQMLAYGTRGRLPGPGAGAPVPHRSKIDQISGIEAGHVARTSTPHPLESSSGQGGKSPPQGRQPAYLDRMRSHSRVRGLAP